MPADPQHSAPGAGAARLTGAARAAPGPRASRAGALRDARTCYDHLAGRAGVALLDALLTQQLLIRAATDSGPAGAATQGGRSGPVPGEFAVTAAGASALAAFGVDVESVRRSRRRLAGACLDWTERRPHLSGALGAAVTARMLELRWFERPQAGRGLRLTQTGTDGLAATFGCVIAG
jgi:hypothetical protein